MFTEFKMPSFFGGKPEWLSDDTRAFGDFYYYAEADGVMVLITPAKYIKISSGVNATICRAYLDRSVPVVNAAFPDSPEERVFIIISSKFLSLNKKLQEALITWNRGFINKEYMDTLNFSFGLKKIDEANYLAADRYLLSHGYSLAMVKKVIKYSSKMFRTARLQAVKEYSKDYRRDEADKIVLSKVLDMMESSPDDDTETSTSQVHPTGQSAEMPDGIIPQA